MTDEFYLELAHRLWRGRSVLTAIRWAYNAGLVDGKSLRDKAALEPGQDGGTHLLLKHLREQAIASDV